MATTIAPAYAVHAFAGLTTICGRPVTRSQAGRTITASTGRIAGSPTISAPMKIASQPLRVTATRGVRGHRTGLSPGSDQPPGMNSRRFSALVPPEVWITRTGPTPRA